MNFELQDKRVLITGGTRGIGKSIAECFVNEGSRVSICGRNCEQVKSTVNYLMKNNTHVYGQSLDVSDSKALKKWIIESAKQLDGIDIYISNVSAQSFEWKKSFDIDLMASINGIEAALPFIKHSKSGSVIAIASKAATLSAPGYKPYSAMKIALISYISSLSRELAPMGIRANCVSPGEIYFTGGFWERISTEDPDLYKKALSNNPMKRFGTPLEVAQCVLFLASPLASFISGANLLVDGAGREHVQF
jgi:3-oxoacyl-[acyl-carrier protein] reductase